MKILLHCEQFEIGYLYC